MSLPIIGDLRKKKLKTGLMLASIFVLVAAILVVINDRRAAKQNEPVVHEEKIELVRLEIVSEGVEIKTPTDSDFIKGLSGQELVVGSVVKTDATGRAKFIYPNGDETRIDHDSEVELKKFDSQARVSEVKITKGRVWSRVAKLLGQESYQTESNNLMATVRGTSYGHAIMANGQDTIIVSEGEIAVDCFDVDQEAKVNIDEKASFPCADGQNILQRKMTMQEKQDEWYLFNNPPATATPKATPKLTPAAALTPKQLQTTTPTPSPTAGATTPTPTSPPTPTSSPTPQPETTGPTMGKFCASPTLVGRQTCSVSFQAEIMDPSGVGAGDVLWQSFDSKGASGQSGQIAMSPDGNIWYAYGQVSVPVYGHIDWQVRAKDSLGNMSTSSSNITVNADAIGCN